MGAYLAFNATSLVSTATYCCMLSFNRFLTGQDHGDISLAGVWLHKERFLRTSLIVIAAGESQTAVDGAYFLSAIDSGLGFSSA